MRLVKQIWQKTSGKISILILSLFLFLFVFADYIANEKPIICKINNEIYFPVSHASFLALGLTKPYSFQQEGHWQDIDYKWAVFPIIPFSPETIHFESGRYHNPGYLLEGISNRTFYLGSDRFGRDVASGIVHGTRSAFTIGLLSVLLASIIAIFFGVISGYFGDNRIKLTRIELLFFTMIGFLFLFYTVYWYLPAMIAIVLIVVLYVFIKKKYNIGNANRIKVPIDMMIMRIIEIFDAIPALFFLLLILAMISHPTIWTIILIIGTLTWVTKARILRGEVMKVKEMKYIKAAQTYNLTSVQIIKRHILPNSISSLIIKIAFSVSAAILLEASISFLGLGLSVDEVTWGAQLSDARNNYQAWWLAVFPGLAIFLVVYAFNNLGDRVNEIMNPRVD